ncbi:MAG: hypothetical protein ACI82F_002416 [Planctomycetota bacterium]|jgi:hypothetical protein
MTDLSDPRCFTCRNPVQEPPVLNELDDGTNCPACRDRVLDSLPSLLPSAPSDLEIESTRDDETKARGQHGPHGLILVQDEFVSAKQAFDDPPQPA